MPTPTEGIGRLEAVVVIASAGRPGILGAAMRDVDAQLPASVGRRIVSVPDAASLPPGAERDERWTVVSGARGAATQRNAALDALTGSPVVFFFDDDAVIRPDYVANALAFFERHPEVAGITGRVLLDGAVTGEIPEARAREAIALSQSSPTTGRWRRGRELYGCNFAIRTSAAPGLRFDDRLPLYSWLEDHDLARRLMPHGLLAKVDDCVIVHRAAASGGRQSHVRLGYSQVMNPVHLWRKGSFPIWLMLSEAGKRVGKNGLRSVFSPEREWRRRRLAGNALAAADVLRGRITPERILEL